MSELILPPVLINELNTFVDLGTYSDKRFVVSQWLRLLNVEEEEKFNEREIEILYEYYFNKSFCWGIEDILDTEESTITYDMRWLINKGLNHKILIRTIITQVIYYIDKVAMLNSISKTENEEEDIKNFLNENSSFTDDDRKDILTKYGDIKKKILIFVLDKLCLPCYEKKLNNWIDEFDPYFLEIELKIDSQTFDVIRYVKMKGIHGCSSKSNSLITALRYRDYTVEEQKELFEYINVDEVVDPKFIIVRAAFNLKDKILFTNIMENNESNFLVKNTINFLYSNIKIFNDIPDITDGTNVLQKLKDYMSSYDVDENKEFLKALEQVLNCKLDLLYEIFNC